MPWQAPDVSIPRQKVIKEKPYDLVEFDHNFYIEKFSQGLSKDHLENYKLRLCAFLDLKE